MSYDPHDTICAIATASGGAARGMIRVSGREALVVVPLFRTEGGSPLEWPARATALCGNVRISLSDMTEPTTASFQRGETIVPCELFVWPSQRSYTREPVVELHILGSTPLLEALLAAVCQAGARLAEPGEFTLRAFLAGRIDLTQAEAVLGVIDANRADELDDALAQLAGGLAQPLHALRDNLLQLLAELEAGLDFVEEDIQFVSRREVLTRLDSACRILAEVDHQMTSRQIAPAEYQVALVGPPNAGKSSLFNALIKLFGIGGSKNQPLAAEALVSPARGTTRDYLTAAISLEGVRCELIDTAGIEASEIDRGESLSPRIQIGADIEIERTATALAAEHRRRATVRALCLDASCLAGDASNEGSSAPFVPDCDVLVLTKADLLAKPIPSAKLKQIVPTVLTSSRTDAGIVELSKMLCTALTSGEPTRRGIAVASTANRCGETIRHAGAALASARDLAEHDRGAELIAAEIRASLNQLGKVVGAIYTEDLLDRIFSTFCIGK